MQITSQAVIDSLENEFDVRSYSGRSMYGAQCVGVNVEDMGAVMKIAAALVDAGFTSDDLITLGEWMRVDSMGLGQIIYWPRLKLSEKELATLNA